MNKKNILLTINICLLCLLGFAAIFSATSGGVVYTKNQVIAFTVGFLIYLLLSDTSPYTLKKSAPWAFSASVLMLISVLVLGIGYNQTGSKSWLYIGGFSLQPSELAKIGFIISFSSHTAARISTINSLKTIAALLSHSGLIILLLCLQPDFGTAFVFAFITVAILFCAGLKKRFFAAGIASVLVLLPVIWINLKEYQKNRILVFFKPDLDPTGAGYNVLQSKTALGSGGLLGQGYLRGMLTQSELLPAKHTDFIFSVIGEETGLIGCAVVLILLYSLIFISFFTAIKAENPFDRLLCTGIGSMLLYHTVVNTGMCAGLFPVTGIPLPYLSYGGSSLVANLAAAGLLAAIRSHLPPHCRKYHRGRHNKPHSD